MHLGAHIGLLDVFTEPIAHPFPSFQLLIYRSTDLAGGEEHLFGILRCYLLYSFKYVFMRRLSLLLIYLHGIALF